MKSVVPAVLVLSLVWSSPASALLWFFKVPPKLLTCELMMRSGLQTHSTKESILPSLHEAWFKFMGRPATISTGGVNFRPQFYAGSSYRLGTAQGKEIRGRLSALEADLEDPVVDNYVVAMEFRGGELGEARTQALQAMNNLTPVYNEVRKERFPTISTLFHHAFTSLMLISGVELPIFAARSLGEGRNSDFFAGTLLSGIVYGYLYIHLILKVQQKDSGFLSVLDFSDRMVRGLTRPDEILISSYNMIVPLDFDRMVRGTYPEEAGRAAGVEKAHGPPGIIVGRNLTRSLLSSEPPPENRFVNIDHILFTDDRTGEPVWIFAYRSSSRPF